MNSSTSALISAVRFPLCVRSEELVFQEDLARAVLRRRPILDKPHPSAATPAFMAFDKKVGMKLGGREIE
jgi:hypothetical protein